MALIAQKYVPNKSSFLKLLISHPTVNQNADIARKSA